MVQWERFRGNHGGLFHLFLRFLRFYFLQCWEGGLGFLPGFSLVSFFWAGGSRNMFRARLDWKRKNPMERKQSKLKFSSLFQFPSNLYMSILSNLFFFFSFKKLNISGLPGGSKGSNPSKPPTTESRSDFF